MKALVLTQHLRTGLSTVAKVVSNKSQLPILGNVLINFNTTNGITLTTTNLELSIKTQVKAAIEEEGTTTTPHKILYELVTLTKEDKLEIEMKNNILSLKNSTDNHSLATTSGDDFPQVSRKEKDKVLEIDTKTFTDILNQVIIATTQDETRPILSGVLISPSDKGLVFVTTDGYRLSVKTTSIKKDLFKDPCIVPVRTILEVDRIAKEKKAEKIEAHYYQDNKLIEFTLDKTEILSRLVEGDFPKYQKIIPTSFTTRVILEREQFLDSIKAAAVFARESANIVKVSVKNNTISLTAKAPQIGETTLTQEGTKTGEDLEIAFNFRFLLDFLNATTTERIIFETNGSLSPTVFKSEKDDTFLHVIMPVRLQQ